MNPIALRHGRRIIAYACGRCLTVPTVGSYLGYPLDAKEHSQRVGEKAGEYRVAAARCCSCLACGAILPEGQRGLDCPSCAERHNALLCEKAEADAALERMLIEACGGVVEPALRLRQEMHDYAESFYDRDWIRDLEHDLWAQAVSGETGFPATLRTLADEARGWWRDHDGEPAFIALEDWERLYARWITARVSLTPPGAGVG